MCGFYSRAATISTNSRSLRRLFEGGDYSKCGVYSRKYGMGVFFVQLHHVCVGKCSGEG